MSIHPAHRILFATLVLAGCADDTASTTGSVASERGDAAADSGAPDADTGAKQDASQNTDQDASQDAGRPSERDAAVAQGDAASGPSDDEQAVKLRFHAQLGEQKFACGSSFEGQGSAATTITMRDLRLFVQDVALVDTKGREVPVKLDTRDPWQTADVALLDFEDSSGDCFGTPETNDQITGVVPKGEYVALRFSHGVPEQLNHSDPKLFPPPLQTPGMSWNWLLGLRFVRLEVGTLDADSDLDAGAAPGSFSLHVGSTGCAGNQNQGTIKCAKPNRSRVELKDFSLGESEIVLDVRPLLSGSDLSQTVECHSGTAVCDPMFEALGVSYASGAPSDEQTVFRLR